MEDELLRLVKRYPDLKSCETSIAAAYRLFEQVYGSGGKVLICGNGGSSADADHITGELMKGFIHKRSLDTNARERFVTVFPGEDGQYLADQLQGALPTISLSSQTAMLTAISNDVAADMAFAQQVYGYGRPGDALITLSTSGNSLNVVRAVQVAKVMGLATIGLTGSSGGRLAGLCDVAIQVPYDSTPDVQERHLPIYHTLCILVERRFYPTNQ